MTYKVFNTAICLGLLIFTNCSDDSCLDDGIPRIPCLTGQTSTSDAEDEIDVTETPNGEGTGSHSGDCGCPDDSDTGGETGTTDETESTESVTEGSEEDSGTDTSEESSSDSDCDSECGSVESGGRCKIEAKHCRWQCVDSLVCEPHKHDHGCSKHHDHKKKRRKWGRCS